MWFLILFTATHMTKEGMCFPNNCQQLCLRMIHWFCVTVTHSRQGIPIISLWFNDFGASILELCCPCVMGETSLETEQAFKSSLWIHCWQAHETIKGSSFASPHFRNLRFCQWWKKSSWSWVCHSLPLWLNSKTNHNRDTFQVVTPLQLYRTQIKFSSF